MEILKSVCHLSITVKSNLLAYQDMLQSNEDSHKSAKTRKAANNLMESSVDGSLPLVGYNGGVVGGSRDPTAAPLLKQRKDCVGAGIVGPGASGRFLALSSKQLLNRAFNKFMSKPKSLSVNELVDEASLAGGGSTCTTSAAAMYPVNNMSAGTDFRDGGGGEDRSEFPEHVLKVYKADQTCKYLLVHKETSAHEVVMLSLQEFGITEPSTNFTLCEVSVAEGCRASGW